MSATALTYADVAAAVQAVIIAYGQALDDGRGDEIVAMFGADAVFEIPSSSVYAEGDDALRGYFSAPLPGMMRHIMTNTVLTAWDDRQATAISDLAVVAKKDAAWVIRSVGRYHDTLRNFDGVWRFERRTLLTVN